MTYPTITPLPDAPSRSQSPDDFSNTADTFVAALPDLVTDVNAAGAYIDEKTISVGNDFQGAYSAGTTYTTGQSVLYADLFFLSLVDSNTGNTPDSSPSQWVQIAGSAGGGGGGGALNFVASGAISNGDVVSLNSDGTVSVSAASAPGAEGTFTSNDASYISATFDSNSNKVVVAYRDNTNSNYGTAAVGTVSGTSITFGTPVVFEAASTLYTSAVFDSNSNKVVIGYRDDGNSNAGTAIVGTVSGTSISFGTPVVFEATAVNGVAATFDSNSNKVVIFYPDAANGSYGTAVVGTVSGTSISFGTPVVFLSSNTRYITPTFDSSNNKIAILFQHISEAQRAYGIVGTVSGTSISFGTAVLTGFNNDVYIDSATFDSNSNKAVFSWRFNSNNVAYLQVGTVSGTSISFGTEVAINGSNASSFVKVAFDSNRNTVASTYVSGVVGYAVEGTVSGTSISFGLPFIHNSTTSWQDIVFDSSANKAVIAYDDTTGPEGNAIVATFGNGADYVGVAAQDISDAGTGSVTLLGGVNEGQSGLTIGADYYLDVSTAGGLTTATTTGIKVGRAMAADKILVTEG